jgi:hypothetical protein
LNRNIHRLQEIPDAFPDLYLRWFCPHRFGTQMEENQPGLCPIGQGHLNQLPGFLELPGFDADRRTAIAALKFPLIRGAARQAHLTQNRVKAGTNERPIFVA